MDYKLNIIVKNPGDGNPLERGNQKIASLPGSTTVAYKLEHKGKEYGQYIEIGKDPSDKDVSDAVGLMLKSAFEVKDALQEGEK